MAEVDTQAAATATSDASGPLLSDADLKNFADLASMLGDDDGDSFSVDEEADAGDEEPDEQAKVEAKAEAAPEPDRSPDEDYKDLVKRNDAWRKGEDGAEPLSTEEKARLRAHEQSIEDRQRAEQQARELQRQNREKLEKLKTEAPQRVFKIVQDEVNAAIDENRAVSPSLLQHAVGTEVSAILKDAAPLVLRDYSDGLASYALDLVDTPAVRKALEDSADFPARLQVALNASYTRGIQDSPAAKEVAKKDEEITRLKKELQDLKASRGAKGSGATSDGREAKAITKVTGTEDLDTLRKAERSGALVFTI